MITRYEDERIKLVFSEDRKYRSWLAVTNAILRVEGEQTDSVHYWDELPQECAVRERETHHDVAAFLHTVEERASILPSTPDSFFKRLHKRATSSDIVDNALSASMWDANGVVTDLIKLYKSSLLEGLGRYTPVYARTHGRKALTMLERDRFMRLDRDLELSLGMLDAEVPSRLGGPVGNSFTKEEQEQFAIDLSRRFTSSMYRIDPTGTQCIPRHLICDMIHPLVLLSCVLERHATYFRSLMMEGIDEYHIKRDASYVGSSSMPFKNNPTKLERVCGISRLSRGYYSAMLESVALWGERDISHSSVDRESIPGIYHCVAQQLKDMAETIGCLVFNSNNVSDWTNDEVINSVHKEQNRAGERKSVHSEVPTK